MQSSVIHLWSCQIVTRDSSRRSERYSQEFLQPVVRSTFRQMSKQSLDSYEYGMLLKLQNVFDNNLMTCSIEFKTSN